jgi:hypothetical protein
MPRATLARIVAVCPFLSVPINIVFFGNHGGRESPATRSTLIDAHARGATVNVPQVRAGRKRPTNGITPNSRFLVRGASTLSTATAPRRPDNSQA